jgi:hypothetical protein
MAGHGSADPLIPAIIANLTLDVLRGMGECVWWWI